MAANAGDDMEQRMRKMEEALGTIAKMVSKNERRRRESDDDDDTATTGSNEGSRSTASDTGKALRLAERRGLASPLVLATPEAWHATGATAAELRAALSAEFVSSTMTARDKEITNVIAEACSQWASDPSDPACVSTLVDLLFFLRAPPGGRASLAFARLRAENLSKKHRRFAAATSTTASATHAAQSAPTAPTSGGRVPKEKFAALSAEEKKAVTAAHALLKRHGAF
jgi:hypothetical protein